MSQSTNNKEIEIKLCVASFADYLKILGFLGNVDGESEQLNCFFDTEDRQLSEAGWALRVRVSGDHGLVTVKGIPTEEGLAVVREEIESTVPRGTALAVVNLQHDIMSLSVEPIEFIRDRFPEVQLARLVEFRTLRKHKLFKMGDCDYQLMVDQTSFHDGSVDYELEVELPDIKEIATVEDCLRKLFDRLKIPFEPQSESKFERALKCSGIAD
jgi:inorganic triphosphatase YgiF